MPRLYRGVPGRRILAEDSSPLPLVTLSDRLDLEPKVVCVKYGLYPVKTGVVQQKANDS